MVVRVRVGVPCHFGNGIEGAFGGGVVAQHAIPALHLLERTNSVGFRTRTVPHLLALHEKCVPVVVMRVGAEDPIVSCVRSRSRHLHLKSWKIYTVEEGKPNKMCGIGSNHVQKLRLRAESSPKSI